MYEGVKSSHRQEKQKEFYYNLIFIRIPFPMEIKIIFMQKILIISLLLSIALAQIAPQEDPVLYPIDPIAEPPYVPYSSSFNPSFAYRRCALGERWDSTLEQCVSRCIQQLMCIATKVWSPILCACVCPTGPTICPPGFSWDNNSCGCISRIPV